MQGGHAPCPPDLFLSHRQPCSTGIRMTGTTVNVHMRSAQPTCYMRLESCPELVDMGIELGLDNLIQAMALQRVRPTAEGTE
jgi:hypothetical protein